LHLLNKKYDLECNEIKKRDAVAVGLTVAAHQRRVNVKKPHQSAVIGTRRTQRGIGLPIRLDHAPQIVIK
jgi:hypothetical protein